MIGSQSSHFLIVQTEFGTKEDSQHSGSTIGVACFVLIRSISRIAVTHRVTIQDDEPIALYLKVGINDEAKLKQFNEIMGLRKCSTMLLKERLKVLFGDLLGVKADGIIVRVSTSAQFASGCCEIALCFLDPLNR